MLITLVPSSRKISFIYSFRIYATNIFLSVVSGSFNSSNLLVNLSDF
jgi:hypothetical protein